MTDASPCNNLQHFQRTYMVKNCDGMVFPTPAEHNTNQILYLSCDWLSYIRKVHVQNYVKKFSNYVPLDTESLVCQFYHPTCARFPRFLYLPFYQTNSDAYYSNICNSMDHEWKESHTPDPVLPESTTPYQYPDFHSYQTTLPMNLFLQYKQNE